MKVVSSSLVGSNCWLPCRFGGGGRCLSVARCKYPEKKECKAVNVEIQYLKNMAREIAKSYAERIATLQIRIVDVQGKDLEKKIEKVKS